MDDFFLECIEETIAFASQEGFRFHFPGLEDGYRRCRLAVVRNVQVVDGDVGLAEMVENFIEASRRIAHFDGDDAVHVALVTGFFQLSYGQFRIGNDEADDAEFGAVIGQHGVDIDIGIGQDRRHLAQGALVVFSKDRNLMEHEIRIPFHDKLYGYVFILS